MKEKAKRLCVPPLLLLLLHTVKTNRFFNRLFVPVFLLFPTRTRHGRNEDDHHQLVNRQEASSVFFFSLLTPGPPPPPFLLILRSFADHQMSDRAGLTLVLLGRVSNIRGFDVHGLQSRRQLFFFSRVQYRRLVVQSERLALFSFSFLIYAV
jgi:hypothetical protein